MLKSILKKLLPPQWIKRIKNRLPGVFYRFTSFSQQGEDLILYHLFLGFPEIKNPVYLDIGANHPFRFSNSAKFYFSGSKGFLVEPDPELAQLLRKKRKRDTVFENGIALDKEKNLDFYLFEANTLNTFSKEEAERCKKMGYKLRAVKKIPLMTINELMEKVGLIDLLSLDVEGFDEAIIKSLDFKKYRPLCICIETLSFETEKKPEKNYGIINFLIKQNYFVFADTYVNTIFVDKVLWEAKFQK